MLYHAVPYDTTFYTQVEDASKSVLMMNRSQVCTICLDPLESTGESLCLMACNHSFHAACIAKCPDVCPGENVGRIVMFDNHSVPVFPCRR